MKMIRKECLMKFDLNEIVLYMMDPIRVCKETNE